MSSLISIIVPVYKTESYLRKCLDSIINQTYENLEIILVDDGSPDNCGKICDEYAASDSRIKVFHQKNAGLSTARNAALKIASGEYVGFVDSDDWIDADMFEILCRGAMEYKADIAICGFYYVDGSGNKFREIREKQSSLYGREDALHHLIVDEKFTNHIWNKLYKKELFDDVHFPQGRVFEDIATTYKLFEKADRIVFLNSSKYNYQQRDDSIVGAKTVRNEADRCFLLYERLMDIIKRYPNKKEILLAGFYIAFADLGYAVSKDKQNYSRTYKKSLENVMNFARKNEKSAWKCRLIGRACKLNCSLFLRESSLSLAGIRLIFYLSRIKASFSPR